MNTYETKNNIYKNGEWHPNHSEAMKKEAGKNIEPTTKQKNFRDNLYNFCAQKGILKGGFPLARTKRGMHSNIRSLITIIEKNGLANEFFGERKEQNDIESCG